MEMEELEKRVRQLEIENIALQFQVALLNAKMNVTLPEMTDFAKKCLEEMPGSEINSNMHLYLQGFIQGETS